MGNQRLLSLVAAASGAAFLLTGCGGGPPPAVRKPPIAPGQQTATGSAEASGSAATASSGPATAPDPSTYGTIEVTVKYAGAETKNKKIDMSSDSSCATGHEAEARQEKFIRNENMTMANAVAFLSDGWQRWKTEPPADTVVMDQKGCKYIPHVVSVSARQPIEFKNSDDTLHNVHPVPRKNKQMNKATPANSSITHAFPRDELGVKVKCDVHPWMASYVNVFKHPWHTVTGEGDGAAKIASVPAGKYKIKAWHETLKESKAVDVEVKKGETVKVTLNF